MIVGVALAVPAPTAHPSELGGVMSAPERKRPPRRVQRGVAPENLLPHFAAKVVL